MRGGAFHTRSAKGAPPGRQRHQVIKRRFAVLAQGLQAPHGVAGIRSCAGIFSNRSGRSVRWPVAALGRGCAVTAGAAAGADHQVATVCGSKRGRPQSSSYKTQPSSRHRPCRRRAVASAGFGRHMGLRPGLMFGAGQGHHFVDNLACRVEQRFAFSAGDRVVATSITFFRRVAMDDLRWSRSRSQRQLFRQQQRFRQRQAMLQRIDEGAGAESVHTDIP